MIGIVERLKLAGGKRSIPQSHIAVQGFLLGEAQHFIRPESGKHPRSPHAFKGINRIGLPAGGHPGAEARKSFHSGGAKGFKEEA